MKTTNLLKTIAVLFLLCPGVALPLARENWPTYMGNQYLTGNNDGIIPEGEGVLWSFEAAGQFFNPVSVNNRVYVVSTDNHLYCLDAADGSLLWKFKSEGPLTRMVVVFEGYVYLPAGRFLYCLDEKSGAVIWGRRDPSFGFYGTPTVARGRIFYGNRKGFYAREIQNGHPVWENAGIYTYGGFPSYWNGMVYTMSKEFQNDVARLVALNESDGSIRWSADTVNVPNIYSPVVYDERIYLSLGNQLMVFAAETGKKLFEKSFFPAQVASHPVFSQGKIFLSLQDGTILTVDPESGVYAPLYRVPYGTQFAVVGSFLYIPVKTDRGALDVVDAEKGVFVRRISIGEAEPSSFTISRGVVFLPAGGTLLAIGKGRFLASSRPREESGGAGAPASGKKPGGESLAARPAGEGGSGASEKVAPQKSEGGEAGAAGSVAAGAGSETSGPAQSPKAAEETSREAPAPPETATIRGTVKDRDTGRPLDGTVEAATELPDGSILQNEEPIREGSFTIDVPRAGKTDLIISSPGYAFKAISLPGEKAIDDLSLQPIEVSLPRARKGETFTVESVNFGFESANLEPASLPALQRLLAMMRENPSIKVEIAGHTDATGGKEVNMSLSRRRAEAVASWLIRNGVLSKRLATVGYGDTRPVADNATPEGRRKNRRTEIRIVE
jgi:outer membrane protein OmpA-like peptidoglycan-associated protein